MNYPDGRLYHTPLPVPLLALPEQRIILMHDAVLVSLVELLLPPRINILYDPYQYTGKDGKKHLGLRLSAEARGYGTKIAPFVQLAMRPHLAFIAALRADKKRRIAIHSRFYFNANRTDVDAGIKALQDALTSMLDINDNRVIQHTVEKYIMKQREPCVIVEVVEARYQ